MENLTKYKKQLEKLVNDLNQFDIQRADEDYLALKVLFDYTYDSGVLDLFDVQKGQLDIYKLELFTALTKVNGSLAFLAIQILAANNIMAKNQYERRYEFFKKKCGIAINHLRAPITIVEAVKCDGGYRINGTLTWASGYKIFDTLLIGFHCEGKEFETMAPFKSDKGFDIVTTDETFVGYGLNTVTIKLNDFYVKDEDIVSSNPIGNYTKAKSASKTVHFCIYALGNTALENIDDEDFTNLAYQRLNYLKDRFLSSSDTEDLDNLRVELFEMVQHIITTAMIINGGKSILLSEVFQRLYRELIMFNSNGLNNTLKAIFKRRFKG